MPVKHPPRHSGGQRGHITYNGMSQRARRTQYFTISRRQRFQNLITRTAALLTSVIIMMSRRTLPDSPSPYIDAPRRSCTIRIPCLQHRCCTTNHLFRPLHLTEVRATHACKRRDSAGLRLDGHPTGTSPPAPWFHLRLHLHRTVFRLSTLVKCFSRTQVPSVSLSALRPGNGDRCRF